MKALRLPVSEMKHFEVGLLWSYVQSFARPPPPPPNKLDRKYLFSALSKAFTQTIPGFREWSMNNINTPNKNVCVLFAK